ncbi:DUF2637 domain-containing protein [Streptomyces sp. NPDC051219]|uniref:DUF2637 domain-containing protein n=1 Tax=Streptomyces sp. NPDC051219 TaxID=3155283 RepID=UPI003442893E
MRALPVRIEAVLIQAGIAAALSFAHLHDLAVAAGPDGWKAWVYPVSVDLLLVAAWKRLRSGESKASGWSRFLIALAASLGANVATAGLLDLDHVPAWLRVTVAGWPAVASPRAAGRPAGLRGEAPSSHRSGVRGRHGRSEADPSTGASSIYFGKDGKWHGRVTVGVRDDGRPDRRHIERKTKAEVTKAVRDMGAGP